METKAAEVKRIPKCTDKRPRPATYYRLTEKDHPTIIDGLKHFASIYHIALKIGCGYTTLKLYIHKHPELLKVQQEAKASIDEFVESQIVRKCASGYFPALAFYAERRMGWTQHQTIENIGELPVINFGIIAEKDLPPEQDDSEVKALEAEFLRGDKEAAEAKACAEKGGDSGNRDDLYDDANPDEDGDEAEFWGADIRDGDEPFGDGGMFS